MRLVRADNVALTPGAVMPLIATVRNKSNTNTSIMVGVPAVSLSTPVPRSAAVTVPAQGQAELRFNLPVPVEWIRNEQYTRQIHLIDPRTGQTWRDGVQTDNAATITVPVQIDYYNVTVSLEALRVKDDCSPGSTRSSWNMFLGAIPFTPPSGSRGTPGSVRWSALVSSGQLLRPSQKVVLYNVKKDQTIDVSFRVGLRTGFDSVGTLRFWTQAVTWKQFGGRLTAEYPALTSGSSHVASCGSAPFSASFKVNAVPVTLR